MDSLKKYIINEILVTKEGNKINLTWAYFERHPTEEEKQATRDAVLKLHKNNLTDR